MPEVSEEIQGLALRQSPENLSETREQSEAMHRLERTDRVHTTDNIYENRGERGDHNRARNTEEPASQIAGTSSSASPVPFKNNKTKRRHRFIIALIAAIVLTIVLIIASNTLGTNIISRVGGAHATIQITEKPTQLQESYVLTAAPQYTTPDPNKFAMPARVLKSTSTDGNQTTTTGRKNIDATAAQGALLFINMGDTPVAINTNQDFFTSTGIHIKITQDVSVPARQNGQDGALKVSAMAVNTGKAGNIAANTPLQTNLPPQITVQNPNAFSGGTDAQVIHIVAQADIDGLHADLRKKLTQQAVQQLQNQLASGELMATQPTYSETVTANFPVGAQTDQVQVTLSVQEIVPVYKPAVAIQVAGTLLDNKANHSLGANFKRLGDITKVGDPSVSDANNDTIHLSVTVHGNWIYNFSTTQTDQWRHVIQGLTPAAAQAYLKAQQYISDVHIELPFGADHLPSTAGDIKIEFM